MHHALLTVKQMKNFVLEEYCQMVAREVIIAYPISMAHRDVTMFVHHHPVCPLQKHVLVDMIQTLNVYLIIIVLLL